MRHPTAALTDEAKKENDKSREAYNAKGKTKGGGKGKSKHGQRLDFDETHDDEESAVQNAAERLLAALQVFDDGQQDNLGDYKDDLGA